MTPANKGVSGRQGPTNLLMSKRDKGARTEMGMRLPSDDKSMKLQEIFSAPNTQSKAVRFS